MEKITIAVVCASILVLAGCGGGSPVVSSATDRAEGDPGSAQIEDLLPPSETTLSAASRAATARAKFGSVTQSSNVASGTTTDSASASFDGNQPTFRVTRSDGSVENFSPPSDSSTDTDSSDDDADAWTLRGQESGNSISIAFVEANWNQAAQSEWFARGVWIKTADADNPSPQNIEIGAFVDGPEIESDADLGGLTGSATYRALVSGIYVSTDDELDTGTFNSILSLTANFTSNTVSGCVGCNDAGIEYEEGFDQDETSSDTVPYRLRLNGGTISDNGRIAGGGVTVETDLNVPITTRGGSWSGRFSNRNNIAGRPRAVAGTLGSSFTTGTGEGAETIVFVGSFLSPPGEWEQ